MSDQQTESREMRRMTSKLRWRVPVQRVMRVAVFLILCLVTVDVAVACPSCKEALASNGGNYIQGYFWSIMFMMSMPFAIVAGFGTSMYVAVKRAQASEAQEAASNDLEMGDGSHTSDARCDVAPD